MRQFAVEYPDFPFVQVLLAQITWYHHISMFPKVKDNVLRAFYSKRPKASNRRCLFRY